MIQKMKKIVIVAPSERKASLLDGVRDLGLVHVSEMAAPDSALSAELNDLNRVRTVLQEAQKAQKAAAKKNKGKVSADVAEDSKPVMLDGAFFNTLHKSLLSKIDKRSSLSDSLTKLKVAMDNIAKWGDFDPSEVNRLKDAGFELSFYLIDAKLMQTLPEDVRYFKLKEIEKKKCTIDCHEVMYSKNGRFQVVYHKIRAFLERFITKFGVFYRLKSQNSEPGDKKTAKKRSAATKEEIV